MNPSPSQNPINTAEALLSDMAQTAPAPLCPEDLERFALPVDFHTQAAKKLLTTVPVRKPAKESFVRTHHDPRCWRAFGILELKEVGKTYLLGPIVSASLKAENEATLIVANLVLSVDRRGNPLFWPLKISDRENEWNNSARRAAEVAKSQWVRVLANMSAGCYDTLVAAGQDGDPAWPEQSYEALLVLAFAGRSIETLDHPVLKELRGMK